jgi:hypothetical protein
VALVRCLHTAAGERSEDDLVEGVPPAHEVGLSSMDPTEERLG